MNKKNTLNKSQQPKSATTVSMTSYTCKTGEITLNEIVGQPEAVSELKKFSNSILYNKIYSLWKISPAKGILFEGPPGTGKTACVRALAGELGDNCAIVEISNLDIASRYMDAPIEMLRGIFQAVEDMAKSKHVVIFIDEIDSMLPARQEQLHEVSVKRVTTFLEWMDGGFSSLAGVTIIGATNNVNGIDPAFLRPGRFDKIITFANLTNDSIIEGLKIHFNKMHLDKSLIGEIDWNVIKSYIGSISLSGAEVKGLIDNIVSEKASAHISNIRGKFDGSKSLKMLKNSDINCREVMPSPIDTGSFIKAIDNLANKRDGIFQTKNKIGFAIPA